MQSTGWSSGAGTVPGERSSPACACVTRTMALARPDRVSALVLAATAPPMPEMVAARTETLQQLMSRPPEGGREDWIASLWAGVVGPGFPERGAQVLAELVEDSSLRPTSQ